MFMLNNFFVVSIVVFLFQSSVTATSSPCLSGCVAFLNRGFPDGSGSGPVSGSVPGSSVPIAPARNNNNNKVNLQFNNSLSGNPILFSPPWWSRLSHRVMHGETSPPTPILSVSPDITVGELREKANYYNLTLYDVTDLMFNLDPLADDSRSLRSYGIVGSASSFHLSCLVMPKLEVARKSLKNISALARKLKDTPDVLEFLENEDVFPSAVALTHQTAKEMYVQTVSMIVKQRFDNKNVIPWVRDVDRVIGEFFQNLHSLGGGMIPIQFLELLERIVVFDKSFKGDQLWHDSCFASSFFHCSMIWTQRMPKLRALSASFRDILAPTEPEPADDVVEITDQLCSDIAFYFIRFRWELPYKMPESME